MTMAPNILAKSLALLLTTLLIGVLLGASITGAVTRHRLESVRALTDGQEFAARIIDVIEPDTPEQLQTIEPIVAEAGGDIEAIIDRTRVDIFLTIQTMEESLAPHLTEAQLKQLQDRRRAVRERYATPDRAGE